MWRNNCVNIFVWFAFSHTLLAFLQHPQRSFSLKSKFRRRRSKDTRFILFSSSPPECNHLLSFVSVESNNSTLSKGWQGWRDEDWGSWRYEATTSWNLRFLLFSFLFSQRRKVLYKRRRFSTPWCLYFENKQNFSILSRSYNTFAIRLLPFYRTSLFSRFSSTKWWVFFTRTHPAATYTAPIYSRTFPQLSPTAPSSIGIVFSPSWTRLFHVTESLNFGLNFFLTAAPTLKSLVREVKN